MCPFGRWLNKQREKVEELAKPYITVIPSEPTVVGHQQQQNYKAKQIKRNAVQKLIGVFTEKKTIATAQEIIDNEEDIKLVARQEAKQITDKAKVKQLKANREAKVADKKTAIANQKTKEAEKLQAVAERNNRVVNSKMAKLAVTVEQEVQKRTSSDTFWQRQRLEDERYKRKQFEKQEQLQKTFEEVKHKSVQKGR